MAMTDAPGAASAVMCATDWRTVTRAAAAGAVRGDTLCARRWAETPRDDLIACARASRGDGMELG
jgi:hypothetical protein